MLAKEKKTAKKRKKNQRKNGQSLSSLNNSTCERAKAKQKDRGILKM
jgi:hypothetical protein